jgi:hypothetical protein
MSQFFTKDIIIIVIWDLLTRRTSGYCSYAALWWMSSTACMPSAAWPLNLQITRELLQYHSQNMLIILKSLVSTHVSNDEITGWHITKLMNMLQHDTQITIYLFYWNDCSIDQMKRLNELVVLLIWANSDGN